MTESSPRTLVITDGGLPALVAGAIEAERLAGAGGVAAVLMPWPTNVEIAAEQLTAVASQARFLRLDQVEPVLAHPGATVVAHGGLADCLGLLVGLFTARATGCTRVVWPVQFHSDDASLAGRLDEIGAAVDRALLVGRLGLLEEGGAGARAVRIEAPLADLTDAQVADLVIDLDAPAYLSWWWRRLGTPDAERVAAEERRLWLPVLRDAGWIESAPAVAVVHGAEQHLGSGAG